jgi:hypothetical protein
LHCRDWVVILSVVKRDFTNDSEGEIRAIINFQSKASFKINLIAVASVAEKDAFTSPIPTLTGDSRVGGGVTWTIGGEDADKFTINAKNGVVSGHAPIGKGHHNFFDLL